MKDAGRDLLDAGWDEGPTGLTYLAGAIRRQLGPLFLIPILCLGIGLGYLVFMPPHYTGTASVRVQIDDRTVPEGDAILTTHVELIGSNRITAALIDDLGLAETYQPSLGKLDRVILALKRRAGIGTEETLSEADMRSLLIRQVRGGLDVRRVGNTFILEIAYTSPDRAQAIRIANGYAQTYIADILARASRAAERRGEVLRQRTDDVRSQAFAAEDTARRLLSQSNYLATSADDLEARIGELRQQLSAVTADEAEIRVQLAMIGDPSELDSFTASAMQTDEMLETARDMASASRKLTQLESQPGVSEELLARLRSSMDEMRNSIEQAVRRIRDQLEIDLAVTVARNAAIRSELGRIQDHGRSSEWAELLAAQRDAETYNTIYERYLNDLEIVERGGDGPGLSLVADARAPVSPSFPDNTSVLALFLTIGVVLASAVAMSREWTRRTMRAARLEAVEPAPRSP